MLNVLPCAFILIDLFEIWEKRKRSRSISVRNLVLKGICGRYSLQAQRSVAYSLNSKRAKLSCHRFAANQVRLQLFVLAYNPGNFLRRLCLPKAINDWSLRSLLVKLIKMSGQIVRHARRFVFQLAKVAVSRGLFTAILGRITGLCPSLKQGFVRIFTKEANARIILV